MSQLRLVAFVAAVALSACSADEPVLVTETHILTDRNRGAVQFRMLDGVNALRRARGLPRVWMSAELNAAAATHSRDMSLQNRPWHFGSDGSSPIERVARVGYAGAMTGEAISETYETELDTLEAWMRNPATRAVLMDRSARDMGFDFFQEESGKIWWTLVMGDPTRKPQSVSAAPFAVH